MSSGASGGKIKAGDKCTFLGKHLAGKFEATELETRFGSNWKNVAISAVFDIAIVGRKYILVLEGGEKIELPRSAFKLQEAQEAVREENNDERSVLELDSDGEELDAADLDAINNSFDDWTQAGVSECQRLRA